MSLPVSCLVALCVRMCCVQGPKYTQVQMLYHIVSVSGYFWQIHKMRKYF